MPVYIDKNLMAPARIINKPDFVIICYYLLLFCGFWVGVVFFCYYFVDFGLGLWSFLERKSEGKNNFYPRDVYIARVYKSLCCWSCWGELAYHLGEQMKDHIKDNFIDQGIVHSFFWSDVSLISYREKTTPMCNYHLTTQVMRDPKNCKQTRY